MHSSPAWSALHASAPALFASLRTFAHAERFFAAVAAALGDRGCVDGHQLYVRDGDAIVPTPLLELTRIVVLDAPPGGVNVRFQASVMGADGAWRPATQATPPPTAPLDLAPRGAAATAGTLVLAEGLSKLTASYDGRGILSVPADAAESAPFDEWIARIVALDPGAATSYRLRRAASDDTPIAAATRCATDGLGRALSDGFALAPFVAIDCAEGKALGRGDSPEAALSAVRDDLFRARPRRADGRALTPSTLTALVVSRPAASDVPQRLADAGFTRVRVCAGHAAGLRRVFVREDARELIAIGEDVASCVDPTTVASHIDDALVEMRELTAAHAREQGDDDRLRRLSGPAQHVLRVRPDGTLHTPSSAFGSADPWSTDGDVLARSVMRASR